MVSDNREDKIKFVKDDMSKELLDDILRSLETHRSGHKEFVQAAVDLGRAIAERKLHLVYRGGDRGSDVPIGEELVVSSMQERITEMLNHADAFIFLPGDLATLEALITFAS
ncbi:hypothetical protein WN943_023306 [Citrus x changshan-huyou]